MQPCSFGSDAAHTSAVFRPCFALDLHISCPTGSAHCRDDPRRGPETAVASRFQPLYSPPLPRKGTAINPGEEARRTDRRRHRAVRQRARIPPRRTRQGPRRADRPALRSARLRQQRHGRLRPAIHRRGALAHAAGRRQRYAGDAPGTPIEPGTAMRIFTGAPLPPGADSIVNRGTSRDGNRIAPIHAARLRFRPPPQARTAGADIPALAPGRELSPRRSAGSQPWRAPGPGATAATHGIIASGDELMAPDEAFREGRSAEQFLRPRCSSDRGGRHTAAPRDRPGSAWRGRGADRCGSMRRDFVTCGGARRRARSAKDALRSLGRRGDLLAGRRSSRADLPASMFSLAASPSSCCRATLPPPPSPSEIFARPGCAGWPASRAMEGPRSRRRSQHACDEAPRSPHWVRGNLEEGLRPSPHQSSGLTRSLVGQRALALLPAGKRRAGGRRTIRSVWLSTTAPRP